MTAEMPLQTSTVVMLTSLSVEFVVLFLFNLIPLRIHLLQRGGEHVAY